MKFEDPEATIPGDRIERHTEARSAFARCARADQTTLRPQELGS